MVKGNNSSRKCDDITPVSSTSMSSAESDPFKDAQASVTVHFNKLATPLPPPPSVASDQATDAVPRPMSAQSTSSTRSKDSVDGSKIPSVPANKKVLQVGKYNLQNEPEENLPGEITLRLKRLKEMTDYSTTSCEDDLEYLRAVSKYGTSRGPKRTRVADLLAVCGLGKVFREVWKQNFQLNLLGEGPEAQVIHGNTKYITVAMWNATDSSRQLCQNFMKTELYKDCLGYLEDPRLVGGELTEKPRIYLVKGLMALFNNTLQHISDSREILRDARAVEIFGRFHSVTNDMVKVKADLVLAYLVNEDEYEQINTNDDNIKFMLKIWDSAMKSKTHQSRFYGFGASEIAQGINKLAANDANKIRIVKNGALDKYVRFLQPDASETEQNVGAEGLWILAFKCRDEIVKHEGSMEALEKLAATSKSPSVLSNVQGALWILKGRDQITIAADEVSTEEVTSCSPGSASQESKKKKKKSKQLGEVVVSPTTEEEAEDEVPHIFISYQWDTKPIMLKVRDQLTQAGFKVWMDVDEMTGSILEAMANAVEKAAVVIICLSQKYKESPNCRTEAEYTFRTQKDIIPLRLQYRYFADGWLGALVGNKLFFDFSVEQKYTPSIKGLIKELGNRGRSTKLLKQPSMIEPVAVTETAAIAPVTTKLPPIGASHWTSDDIFKWLDDNKLSDLRPHLKEMTGTLLLEFLHVSHDAPEFYFTTLRKDWKLSLVQILAFTKILKELK